MLLVRSVQSSIYATPLRFTLFISLPLILRTGPLDGIFYDLIGGRHCVSSIQNVNIAFIEFPSKDFSWKIYEKLSFDFTV